MFDANLLYYAIEVPLVITVGIGSCAALITYGAVHLTKVIRSLYR